MKICSRCNIEKTLDQFRKKTKSSDGLSPWCKDCFAKYDRERYQNGDRARKEKNKLFILSRNRDYIWGILTSSRCTDCNENDPLVLEFDHRDEVEKILDVATMMRYGSIKRIAAEIAKCDIRCANCHRRRTIKQFGLWRGNRDIA